MYALSVHCAGSIGFNRSRLLLKPHPSQTSLARLIVRLEEWKVVGRDNLKSFFCTVRSHLPRFDMSPVWLGALCGRPPSGSAKQPLVKKKVVQLKREHFFSFLVANAYLEWRNMPVQIRESRWLWQFDKFITAHFIHVGRREYLLACQYFYTL